jgi:hypothetical protein
MSYCPIDEAFGHFMTDGINPDPLETSAYKPLKSNSCTKKNKLRRKKVNCNRNNTTFSENHEDIYQIDPEVTDEDREFDEQLESYSPLNTMDLYSLNSNQNSPTKNKKSKLSKKKNKYQPTQRALKTTSSMNNVVEGFDNYTNTTQNVLSNNNRANSSVIRRRNRSSNNRNVEKNEIFEHAPEDDLPIEELREIHGLVNEDEDESESEVEETRPSLRNIRNNSNLKTNNAKNTGGMNSQISEINNKINFIMNQISNKENEITESDHNNIHDIILFVIFGIFVLIILEALYRLISKMVRANTILSNNIARPTNVPQVPRTETRNIIGGNGSSVLSSSDTFDVVREYAKSKQ